MFGKMQELRIIEVIPFIYVWAIWGHHPVFFFFFLISHYPPPSTHLLSSHRGWGLGWHLLYLKPCFPFQEPLFTFGGPKSLTTVTSLFIDMEGDILFQSLTMVINSTIFGRCFMTIFFFLSHGTRKLISDQAKVLVDISLQVLISRFSSVQFSCSVMSDSLQPHGLQHAMPSCPHHQLPEFTQTHIHWVSDAIQPSHPLSSPYPPPFNLSQHQGLF